MRILISKVCVGLAFMCMAPAVGFAAEKSYLCAINEVYECVAVTGCSRISVEDANLTGIMLIDAALAREWDIFFNAISHLMLPVSILGYYSLAYISRMTRSFMIEQLGQEYVTAARVKGLSEFRVVWRHALGNAMLPLVTVIALSYASLLEGAVLTETVFAWPGLGSLFTDALARRDYTVLMALLMLSASAVVAFNVAADLAHAVVDPRVAVS